MSSRSPPTQPSGQLSAATHHPSPPPPNHQAPPSPSSPLPNHQAASRFVDEALGLHVDFDSEEESPEIRHKGKQALKTGPVQGPDGGAVPIAAPTLASRIRSKEVKAKGSYRDALVKPRTFKPRFPAVSSHQEGWLQEERRRSAPGSRRGSVWERLGAGRSKPSIHQWLGPRGSSGEVLKQGGGHLLALLKAKAGARRCFNCFALDHRISQCRDPPRCILCSRFGHKARFCPSPPVSSPPCSHARSPLRSPVGVQGALLQEGTEGSAPMADLSRMVPGDPACRPLSTPRVRCCSPLPGHAGGGARGGAQGACGGADGCSCAAHGG